MQATVFFAILATLPLNIVSSVIEKLEDKDTNLLKYKEFITANDTQECVKQMAKTDNCVARILFLSEEKVPVPKNMEDLDLYCR